MKEIKKEKTSFFVAEEPDRSDAKAGEVRDRLKKPLVFGIMGIIFVACLYLIFGGNKEQTLKEGLTKGINDAVPQASGDGLPEDKGKAYEQEARSQKDQEKREALRTLSDYWHPDTTAVKQGIGAGAQIKGSEQDSSPAKQAMGSYRNMQRSIGTFYRDDAGGATLREENEKLKRKLSDRQQSDSSPDRLELMEQSYRMAAKYFPGAVTGGDTLSKSSGKKEEEIPFLEVLPQRKAIVSKLPQQMPPMEVLQRYVERGRAFEGTDDVEQQVQPANSLRACIDKEQKITGEGSVQLRLLESARIGQAILPRGTIVTAGAKFQNSRLQLQVVSIEIQGNIFPVNLLAYDLDGQKGLNLPYAAEVTALNGTLSNMGNSAGGGITINRSAGQQLTSDAARGLIQGVSGYFSKRVKPQKATLRAGYQLFLVSKEQ